MIVVTLLLGLIVGSFLEALTWRMVKGISIANGRSMCPSCRKKIAWYDNIPLLSFLLLRGKCRECHKNIPLRAPFLEVVTAALFALVTYFAPHIVQNIEWLMAIPSLFVLPYLWFMVSVMVAVFIVDLEHQIIPDEFVFGAYTLTVLLLIFFSGAVWVQLFAGFVASLFLLFTNLITKGKGMGLGDVKFVLLGASLTPLLVLVWMFLSFFIGSIVGATLMALGQKRFGDKIAFGPFLVVAYIITLFSGTLLWHVVY